FPPMPSKTQTMITFMLIPSYDCALRMSTAFHPLIPQGNQKNIAVKVVPKNILETFEKQHGETGLRTIIITGENNPLDLLLGVCDSLQEWDRHAFASPSITSKRMLSRLHVAARGSDDQERIIIKYLIDKSLVQEKEDEFTQRFGLSWRSYLELGIMSDQD
ncbi:MAG: hypothetical protein NTX50_31375, partial [Candidatus Sumerlaeota bacterium]|nr:hypothetical protein [Candidatus Sumerlaeota bacterium]